MTEEPKKGPWQSGDEIIDVRLPKRDYDRLRKMLEREASLGYAMKWGITALLGAATVILTFSDTITRIKNALIGGG